MVLADPVIKRVADKSEFKQLVPVGKHATDLKGFGMIMKFLVVAMVL
jgi:hypothetical protein